MTTYKPPEPTELHHAGTHARDFRTVLVGMAIISLGLLMFSGYALWAWIVAGVLVAYPIVSRVRTVNALRSGRLDESGYHRW